MSRAAIRSTARALGCALLALASLTAFALPLQGGASPFGSLPGLLLGAAGLGALWLLYGAWQRLPRFWGAPGLWALSLFFAATVVFAQSYGAVGTAELVRADPLRAAGLTLGRVPCYRAAMGLIQYALARPSASAARAHGPLWLGGGLLACWLPYLYFVFPGTVSNDSVTQVMEIIGVETLGNANPIFQTALIYFFRGVGVALHSADAGVFLYVGLQALLMAWLLGALLCDLLKGGAPRWLFRLSFGFYALCPVFPLFAFCMGKDTNFSMAVLWLSLLTVRTLRQGGRSSRGRAVCLCLAGALCTLLRNPGFYLALLTLAALLGWTVCRRAQTPGAWRAPLGALATCAAVYGLVHLWVLPGLAIAPMPETENWSLPLQQTARVAVTHPLTAEERAGIDAALPVDQLKAAYNGELSDPVKALWRENVTDQQKAAFFKTWRGLLAKYPATCLSAAFHNTYGYLCPGYMSAIKPTLLIGRQKRSTPEVEAAFGYTVNPRADTLKAFTDKLAGFFPYRAWIAPGLYGWLCLFAVATLLGAKPKRLLIAATPAFFSLAGCLLSAVNGYFRYAMPLYLCAPLMLWLCAQALDCTKERKPL